MPHLPVANSHALDPGRPRSRRSRVLRWPIAVVVAGGTALAPLSARSDEPGEVMAVYSSISPAYHRSPGPDGSFQPESYAFGEGGRLSGDRKDDTIDSLRFLDVARTVAPALAAKNYLPCNTARPKRTNLLIMLYWGATVGTDRTSSEAQYQIAEGMIPPPLARMSPPPDGNPSLAMVSDPSTSGRASEAGLLKAVQAANDGALQESLTLTTMANRQRDRQDLDNAVILGYLPELARVEGYAASPLGLHRQEVIDEVEDSRYYVVLMAYDFQSLLLHKERKLLWETRFSIRQRHNDFGRQLAAMAATASQFFGRNSDGLTHVAMPVGRVEYGDLKVVGYDQPKK